jgi:hypothetical protein
VHRRLLRGASYVIKGFLGVGVVTLAGTAGMLALVDTLSDPHGLDLASTRSRHDFTL